MERESTDGQETGTQGENAKEEEDRQTDRAADQEEGVCPNKAVCRR